MALTPFAKKALILSGKIAVPVAVTCGTIKLGVWGSAYDSVPLTSRVRVVLPDATGLFDNLPSLGNYSASVKSAWNSFIGATTGTIVAIPRSIGSGLTKTKQAIFGRKKDE